MWNLSCLIILVMVVFGSSLKLDAMNNLLLAVRSKCEMSKCEQSIDFLTLVLPDVDMPLIELEKAKMLNKTLEMSLDFTFHYANRNTNTVIIKSDGTLILRNSTGDIDFISPVSTTEQKCTSDVKYHKTAEYLFVKWTNLKTDTNSLNIADYTVAVIIYNSGEIIIIYGEINDRSNDSVQILKYHKLTPANTYEYLGPKLNLSELASNSAVYLKQSIVKNDESPILTTKITTPTTPSESTTETTPDDETTETTEMSMSTADVSINPPPQILKQDINVKPFVPDTTNLNNNTDGLMHKIQANYGPNGERANSLYDEINNAVNTTDILSAVKIIDFNFKFNNVSFQTVSVEPKGKILLNATPKNQVQVEPIPQTGKLEIQSFVMKHLVDNKQLTILLENLKIKSEAITSGDNIIMVVFKKSGIIEIIYKNLVNRDINGGIVVLHTSSNGSVLVEGKVDFIKIENGTTVLFGETNINDDTLDLIDLQYEFKDESVTYLKNDSLLNSYYLINVDNNASKYDDGLASITSKFALKFKQRSLHNVYITNRLEMYFDTVHRKLKLIPDAEKFENTDFKYATTSEYTSLTWSNLQSITVSNVTTIYHVRVLIFRTGRILILFKEIKNGKPSISHEFIPNLVINEICSGTIVHITTSQIENISINNKTMQQLKDEATYNMVAIYPLYLSKWRDPKLVEQFDLATLDILTDFTNTKSSSIGLGFKICEPNGLETVRIGKTMELIINDTRRIKLLPNGNKFTDTSFKLIKQSDFVTMQWDNLKTENKTFSLRTIIYRDGKAFVLYKIVGPSPISNKFFDGSDTIQLDNGTIVQINVCDIKPISFEDLLSLFTSDDCSVNQVAMLDDTKLEAYLMLRPDMTPVPENSSKNITIQSRFQISYGNVTKMSTISVIDSVNLILPQGAIINLVPIEGDEFKIEADIKETTTEEYISMTWNNLKIKSNELDAITYKTIRVIIFKSGTILIIYDIVQNVENVFLPNTNPIELKRGLVVKIDACTLVSLDTPETFTDLLAKFNSSTGNSIQLNEPDFNHYITMNPDSTQPLCTHNLCKVESKFNITYGDLILTTINIANHIQFYFEAQAILDLVSTNDVKRIVNDGFNYTATDEWLSISWYNLTVIEQKTYDIRIVLFANGDVMFLYQFTGIESVRVMNTIISNRSVVKKTVNEIFEYLKPKLLLAEVKKVNQKPVECATLVNDETGKIIKTLFGIKTDKKLLDAGQMKIPMKFKIEHAGMEYQDITLMNRTKFYFDIPNPYHDFMAIDDLIKDEKSLSIYYETTFDYTSISLNNVTFVNKNDGYQYQLNGRAIIYPTGDIIFGYEHMTDSEPQKIIVFDTLMDITAGKVILMHVGNCKMSKAISKPIHEAPRDEAWTSSANQIYYSHLVGLVLAVSLIMLSINYL